MRLEDDLLASPSPIDDNELLQAAVPLHRFGSL